jgi:hypothetical protein
MHYHIRVQGHLDPSWQHRFEGWQIEQQDAGTTLLSGPLRIRLPCMGRSYRSSAWA